MPIVTKDGHSRVDPLALSSLLQRLNPDIAVLEQPLFLGGNAAGSVGTVGINWGMVHACLQLQGIGIALVYPSTWTRVIHSLCRKSKDSGDSKAKTMECYNIVYPNGKLRKDGEIDAAMIAFWFAWSTGLLTEYRKNPSDRTI